MQAFHYIYGGATLWEVPEDSPTNSTHWLWNAVDMWVKIHLLPPCVQDRNGTGSTSNIFVPAGNFFNRLRSTLHQESIHLPGSWKEKRIKFVRNSHYYTKVGKAFDKFGRTGLYPFFGFGSLTARAVPIPAGCVMDPFMSAFRTDAFGKTEKARFALHDAPCGTFLFQSD